MDLLHRYVPVFDRCVRHATVVRADVPTVVSSIRATDLAQSAVVRVLLERLSAAAPPNDPRHAWYTRGLTLEAFQTFGCILLKSHDEREVALGALLTISNDRLALVPADAERFRTFAELDSLKALWHFSAAGDDAQHSTLALETRLRGYGGANGRRLMRRWDSFARFGALGRRDIVAAIKANAESGAGGSAGTVAWD